MVEFALILPLLMALLLGTVTGGLAYNRKISMSNAVREGARFGATLDGDGSWASSVQARTVAMAAEDVTTAQVCVALWKVGTGASYSSPGCTITNPFISSGHPGSTGDCVVEVWAARPDEIQALLFRRSVTLTAKAAARHEQTTTC